MPSYDERDEAEEAANRELIRNPNPVAEPLTIVWSRPERPGSNLIGDNVVTEWGSVPTPTGPADRFARVEDGGLYRFWPQPGAWGRLTADEIAALPYSPEEADPDDASEHASWNRDEAR